MLGERSILCAFPTCTSVNLASRWQHSMVSVATLEQEVLGPIHTLCNGNACSHSWFFWWWNTRNTVHHALPHITWWMHITHSFECAALCAFVKQNRSSCTFLGDKHYAIFFMRVLPQSLCMCVAQQNRTVFGVSFKCKPTFFFFKWQTDHTCLFCSVVLYTAALILLFSGTPPLLLPPAKCPISKLLSMGSLVWIRWCGTVYWHTQLCPTPS